MPHRTTTVVALLLVALAGLAQRTPPLAPQVTPAVLPPAIELPAPASRPEALPDRPITADEAARIALALQPGVAVARAAQATAAAKLAQARAGAGPSLTATAGYSDSVGASGAGGAGGGTGSSLGLSAKQLLYDGQHTSQVVAQARAAALAAEAGLARVQSDIVFQVKQAFYTYVQQSRLVAVQEANVRQRQGHVALAQARLDAGVGLPIDVARAQTAAANAILALTTARNNALMTRATLAQLMGLDPRTPIATADSSEPELPADDLAALLEQALARRPDVQQAEATARAAELGLVAAGTAAAPAVTGSLGWSDRGSGLLPNRNTLTLGVAVSWNLYDSGFTEQKRVEARAALASAQAQAQAARLTAATDVTQAYVGLKTAEQRLATAAIEVANAEESERLAVGRWQAGIGQFIDVLDAQTALVTAVTNRVNARTGLDQARAALARAVYADPVVAPAG